MQTMEHAITIDRDLARRAERKFRHYGTSLRSVISVLVSRRGMPDFLLPQSDDAGDMTFSDVEDAISYLHANV